MYVPPEVQAKAVTLNNRAMLRWRPTSADRPLRVGFRFDQTATTLTIIPLTANTTYVHTYLPDPDGRGVEWNIVQLTQGYAHLRWTDQHTYLHMEFPCGVGGADDERAINQTVAWLRGWEINWRTLLDTKLPTPVIKAAVQAATGRFAADAINLTAWLLQQAGEDMTVFNRKVKKLWALREQPQHVREELAGHRTANFRDMDLMHIVCGVRAVSAKFN